MFEIIVSWEGKWLYTVENIAWEEAQEIAESCRYMEREYKINKMREEKENDCI